MPKLNLGINSVIEQSTKLVASALDDQVAIMSIQNGAYYGLDPIGSRIWELIAKPRSVHDLCDQLMAEFEVSRTQCEEQVLDFLGKLAEADLICVNEPS